MDLMQNITQAKESLQMQNPLIHCITSPVAINDCANAILALGAQPICAEHPQEVAGITQMAKALTVSLANITDARLEGIRIASRTAQGQGIPSLIDLVGITCSPLRMEFARNYLTEAKPAVIKGNYNEIRAIIGADYDKSSGIDASKEDLNPALPDFESQHAASQDFASHNSIPCNVTVLNQKQMNFASQIQQYAAQNHVLVMASGPIDLVSDGKSCYAISNGSPLMARVTGTGCMLTAITGAYLSVCSPLEACLFALVNWGVCGEKAEHYVSEHHLGLGSYHIALLDALSLLTDEELKAAADIQISIHESLTTACD